MPAPSASSVPKSTSHKNVDQPVPAVIVPVPSVVAQSQPQLAPYQPLPQSQPHDLLSPSSSADSSVPPANRWWTDQDAIKLFKKIESRFPEQPDIYMQFLKSLQTFSEQQRNLKEGITTGTKPLTFADICQLVAELLQDHEDLLQEFRQFLPPGTSINLNPANQPAEFNPCSQATDQPMETENEE